MGHQKKQREDQSDYKSDSNAFSYRILLADGNLYLGIHLAFNRVCCQLKQFQKKRSERRGCLYGSDKKEANITNL